MSDVSIADAWLELGQAGRLLDRPALEALPAPQPLSRAALDALRDALTLVPKGKAASGEVLSTLFDVVLEDVCGLRDGWRKGSGLSALDGEKLLDGTVLKPRRVWSGPHGEALAVFAATDERVGMHRGRRAVAHVVEYLRRRKIPLGLLTNGREWRLVWADPDNLAWVEWAADRWLEGESASAALRLLRAVLSRASLLRADAEAELSPLLRAIRDTRRGQAKLSKELGERVRRAVETLLRARRPVLDPVWPAHSRSDVYTASCHFVMRLVVTLFAEARELLPTDNPIYHQAYGLRGLLESLDRAAPERRRARHSAWPRLLSLFKLLHQGSPHSAMLVPSYGGALFRPGQLEGEGVDRALAVLESLADPPDDDTVHRVLVLLTRTTERVREGAGFRTVAVPVDFSELTSEYIGILYEGLLDYELHRAGDEPIVFLSLGDQPALPLDRLEAMSDKALASLVEKAKVKRAESEGEDEGEEDADEPADDDADEPAEQSAEEEDTRALDEAEIDDARAVALKRAVAWAARAAVAGKLVKPPRGKRSSARGGPRDTGNDAAFQEELERAAQSLLADVKLPGELYLVRWGGTRKGAGTFYTRPQLTLPTVRRTLEPLLTGEDGKVRTPEAILALKVCDPAMGSGSFLVAALRVLTEAVVRSLHEHGRVTKNGTAVRLDCALLPDADRELPEERIEAIVRRAVVEHCIYGVDKDRLAVELARVALWVETLDKRLPFTFLDHKLRCGDALIGTWIDRFRHYPLLAWWRQSPDEKWKGVTHEPDQWAKALKARRNEVVAEQAAILSGQQRLDRAEVSDESLLAAFERVRAHYKKLRRVAAGRPDERARIWREHIQNDPALETVREAFDLWCALWFWPLDRLADAPSPLTLAAPSEEARAIVKQLRENKRFFHWELEFPDVFTEKGAGFDAIVANPPWETIQAQSKEFFSDLDPLYRSYGKQAALLRQRELFQADAIIEQRWLSHLASIKDLVNFARHAAEPFGDAEDDSGKPFVSLVARKADANRTLHKKWAAKRRSAGFADPEHPFRYQGEGKPYSYKLFVEQGHALLRRGGELGIITPSGIYTDKGAMELRKLLLNRCRWRWLFGYENKGAIFDIHSSFKFAAILASKAGRTDAIRTAFMQRDLDDWAEARGTLPYPASLLRALSPTSLALVELRTPQDRQVLEAVYSDAKPLGPPSPDGWGAIFGREFNVTDDSKLFRNVIEWEALGFARSEFGRWRQADETAVPVYQGAMIHQFDFSFAGFAGGSGHAVQWERIGWKQKHFRPQNLMSLSDTRAKPTASRLLFRKIGNPTITRTMLASMAPAFPAVDTIVIVKSIETGSDLVLCAMLNSLVFDWHLRLRFGGSGGVGALDHAKMHECVAPLPGHAQAALEAFTMRLNLPNELFAPDWLYPERASRPWKQLWAVTPHERLRLRCILDAIVAALYGLSRDDLRWILRDCDHPVERVTNKAFARTLDPKGFWRVDKSEPPELRHTVLTQVAFDALERLIAEHGGDRDKAIDAFANLNEGEGWMLPDTLRLSDHDLGHDERAKHPQPVASALSPRFYDWQLAQTPEESWAECERHARAILGDEEYERRFVHGEPVPSAEPAPTKSTPPARQLKLIE